MNKQEGNGSVGFFGLLGILFIGLKLAGYIDWSWWLVMAPIYGPIVVFVTTIFAIMFFSKLGN